MKYGIVVNLNYFLKRRSLKCTLDYELRVDIKDIKLVYCSQSPYGLHESKIISYNIITRRYKGYYI